MIGASETSADIHVAASPAGTLVTATMTYDEVNRPLGFTFGPAPMQTAPRHELGEMLWLHAGPGALGKSFVTEGVNCDHRTARRGQGSRSRSNVSHENGKSNKSRILEVEPICWALL